MSTIFVEMVPETISASSGLRWSKCPSSLWKWCLRQNLLWNSLKSGGPDVGQKVEPFCKALVCSGVSVTSNIINDCVDNVVVHKYSLR